MNCTAYAKDFGIRGHVFEIIEQPFLQMIDERLKKIDIEKEREKMITIVKNKMENPIALQIKPATSYREFYFDPTYILKEDIVLPSGKILHKAGTKVNPLEHMDLNRRLFFIDSREISQVNWLKIQLKSIEDRIILIGGNVPKLKKELAVEHVYFDQQGEITKKFGIKGSPAIVVQDGLLIKIEEIKL